MSINFIDLQKQQARIRPQLDAAIKQVLDGGHYIMGDHCQQIEQQLAQYVGVNHCLGCANGTDAIRLAMAALDIRAGDVVLTTNFTFFATSEVIAELGAIPVFVDVDETYNICPIDLQDKLDQALTKGYPVKGIISVDLFGLPADHHAINAIAQKHGLWHIEDSAQGFGGKIDNQVSGSFATIATTSFFPAKPLGCYGDGGAVFTSNDELADKMQSLRVHGKGSHKYENVRIGYNSRLDTLQAAILIEKLKIFDDEVVVKNQLADFYTQSLKNVNEIKTPIIPQGYMSSWAQYTMQVDDRDGLMAHLKAAGVPSMVYYPKTMSQTVALQPYGQYQFGGLARSEALTKSVLSLPMHAYLTEQEKQGIVDCIIEFYKT